MAICSSADQLKKHANAQKAVDQSYTSDGNRLVPLLEKDDSIEEADFDHQKPEDPTWIQESVIICFYWVEDFLYKTELKLKPYRLLLELDTECKV